VKKSIFIGVITTGEMDARLSFALPVLASDPRFTVQIRPFIGRPASHNRNGAVKKFLESQYDYFMMIDDDIIPPMNILDLVEMDKDVIGAVCPQWKMNDLLWVVMDKVENGYKQVPVDRRKGMQEVDAVGSGCLVMRRNVLESICAPFSRQWTKEGLQKLGLDFSFCEKAKEKGFKIYTHWDYLCDHIKSVSLLDIYRLITRENNVG